MKRRSQAPLKRNASAVSREENRPLAGERSAPSAGTRSRWPILLAALVIVAATLIAYSNSFRGAFLFDDVGDVVHNRWICHLWPIRDVFIVQFNGPRGLHPRPVVNFSLALNYAVGGLEPFSYHVVNLLIHVAAGLTLLGIVRRTLLLPSMGRRFAPAATSLALAVALIWTLHPLQTESVTYVTQRFESLMGLFYLLALYAAVRCGTSAHAGRWAVASVAATILAFGCKEVAVSIPITILLYDRAFLAGSFREAWRRRWALYCGLAAAWLLFGLLLWFSIGRGNWSGYALPTTWREYVLSQGGVILHYLRLSFWPAPLVLDYCWPVARTPAAILPGLMIIGGLAAATGYALIRWPKWGFLGACFFMILAPSSSVVPILDLAVEHRMYLSLAAVVAAVVIGGYLAGQWLAGSGRVSRPTLQIAGYSLLALVGIASAILTFERNEDYQSELAIWTDTVNKASRNPRGHYNLGLSLARSGRTNEAIDQYKMAVTLCPTYADAHTNLGNALLNSKRPDEALVHYQTAQKLKPDDDNIPFSLGNAMATLGRYNEAIPYYQKAMEIQPDNAKAHNNLGNALASLGRYDEAITQFSEALKQDPAHRYAGSSRDAALAKREQITAALARQREVFQAHPDDLELLNKIAWTLATNPNASIRNGPEAVDLARRAVRLGNAPNPTMLATLAAACAEAGRFSEAVDTAQQALRLAASQENTALADALRARIKLYQHNLPYREMPPPPKPHSEHP